MTAVIDYSTTRQPSWLRRHWRGVAVALTFLILATLSFLFRIQLATTVARHFPFDGPWIRWAGSLSDKLDEAETATARKGIRYSALLERAKYDPQAAMEFLTFPSRVAFDGAAAEQYSDDECLLVQTMKDEDLSKMLSAMSETEQNSFLIRLRFSLYEFRDVSESAQMEWRGFAMRYPILSARIQAHPPIFERQSNASTNSTASE